MFTEQKLREVQNYLQTVPVNTNIFIGCDSRRFIKDGVWYADYTTVVVIHNIDENGVGKGGVVFSVNDRKKDYDQDKSRPFLRMMNEAYMATELYQQLAEILIDFEVELHLDINKDARHGPNVAHNAAVGYVKGVTGRTVKTKSDAWAAPHALCITDMLFCVLP